MKNIRYIILLYLVLSSCHKDPTSIDGSLSSPSIVGSWLWLQTSGGYIGQIFAYSEGIRAVHTYTSDGLYIVTRNDTVLHTSHYSIIKLKTIYSKDFLDVIVYEDTDMENRVITYLSKDSLCLADNYRDGYCFLYERKRN